MKRNKNQILNLGLLPLLVWVFSFSPVKAANVIFNFAQTTANGMDLFAAPGGALITNSTSPSVYFALGYVGSAYDFTSKTRQQLVSAITVIASSAINWSSVGSAAGGKVNVVFDNNGANGYNTTSYAGSKLVAVVSQGINPLGGSIVDATPIAIVRGSATAGWDSVLAPDASPNPVTQTLNVSDFSSVLVGTYASLVGNVNSGGTTKYDTITLNAIPEPSTSTLLVLSALSLLAASRKKKGANHV